MCNKVDNSCRDEKLTCKGCAYCEKSADELFKELGFEKVIDNEKEVKYQYKNIIMGDKIEHTIQIAKIGKIIFSYRDDKNHQVMGFSKKELKAINKKVEELRMEIVVRLIFSGIILFIGGFSIGAVIGLYLGERK